METIKKELGLRFGAMSPKLSLQIKEQGFNYDAVAIGHFEKDVEALNRLRIRGYLTDSATDAATKKLFNKIKQHVEKLN